MFYQGTLQSGIGQAIQQQKLVACFIRGARANRHPRLSLTGYPDDGATSKQWEDEWLKSGWVCTQESGRTCTRLQLVSSRPDCSSYRAYSNRKPSSCAWKAGRPKLDSSPRFARSRAHLHWLSFTTGSYNYSLGAMLVRKSS